MEFYRQTLPSGDSLAFRVYYDPAVGYLPRLTRRVLVGTGIGVSEELWLVDARRCAAGGFVQTEWYYVRASGVEPAVLGEATREDGPHFLDIKGNVYVGRFVATEFRDRNAPVALTQLDRIVHVIAPGKHVRLPSANRRSLSLAGAMALVGKQALSESSRPQLLVDRSELNEYSRRPRNWTAFYLAGGVAVVLLLGAAGIRFPRFRRPLMLLCLIFVAGCSRRSDAVVRLKARFAEPLQLCAADVVELPMNMVLRNDGDVPVVISKVDGGCSCRQVDQVTLPIRLTPGQEGRVVAQIRNTRRYDGQRLPFTLETNHGNFAVAVSLRVIPRHVVDPDTVSNNSLREGRDWSFELVRRDVWTVRERIPEGLTALPSSSLELTETGTREGLVDDTPGWRFRDTTYHVRLRNDKLGFFKDEIAFAAPGGRVLLKTPVTWRRSRFLSVSPERVVLGSRPVRVFLQCPDEAVELTRVHATPGGIRAVVSSPRELTVMLGADAPGVIDGQIEVGTTALDRPPLRISVVRYAPPSDAIREGSELAPGNGKPKGE